MAGVIESEIGGVFVPVSNVEAARDWYFRLLDRPIIGEILFGHLCVIPMKSGPALVLDSKGFVGPHCSKPAFHFNTDDVEAAHRHALAVGAAHLSPVQDKVFFTLKDPDGNLLMVADVPPTPRFEGGN
jgi:hypothetical protein